MQFTTDLLYTQRIKQRCAYATNILYTQRCVVCKDILYTQRCANSTNILYTQRRQMATLDAPKVLLLTNKTKLTLTITLTLTNTVMQKSKTKLTLTVALTLTDTITVIFFTRILSTPTKRLYRNNKRNFCGGAVAGFVSGPDFFRFLTFYPFADKNSIVRSYFIVEKRVLWGYIRKRG